MLYILLSALFLLLLSFYLTYRLSIVSCTISSKNVKHVTINGYYTGIENGVYIRVGSSASASVFQYFMPDFIQLYYFQKDFTSAPSYMITLTAHATWQIVNKYNQVLCYTVDDTLTIDHPPATGWYCDDSNTIDESVVVDNVRGSLKDSEITFYSTRGYKRSNLESIVYQPVTSFLFVFIIYIAYYLYSRSVDVSMVAFSYEKIVNEHEYWRVITSSLAHYEFLHLGFNMMALYQVASLESVYGSIPYLYLSVDVILITSLICIIIHHIMIYRMNRNDMIHQQSIGYSCVLFAWITVASVKMTQFCPIIFAPSFCFQTFVLPHSKDIIGFDVPINFGPIVLLLVTKVIIPKSSFIGHLSGIIIGFPLAWNMLNWLTPTVLIGSAIVVYLLARDNVAWHLPGYEISIANDTHTRSNTIDEQHLSDFSISLEQIDIYNHYKCVICMVCFLSAVSIALFNPISQSIPRLAMIFICYNSLLAKKMMWYNSDSKEAYGDCVTILVLCCVYVLLMALYDTASLGAAVGNTLLLTVNGLPIWGYYAGVAVLTLQTMSTYVLFALLLFNLYQTNYSSSIIDALRVNKSSIEWNYKLYKSTVRVFDCSYCFNRRVSDGHVYSSLPAPADKESNETSINAVETGNADSSRVKVVGIVL